MNLIPANYFLTAAFDELIGPDGRPRPAAVPLFRYLESLQPGVLAARRDAVDAAIMAMGITFTVYSDGANIDRAWPFDIVPRIIPLAEWQRIEAGLKQRLTALNLFIDDLYNAQRIVADGVFPLEVLEGSRNFREQCRGISPRFGVWAHVCGTDLVRDKDGTVYVLEDNLRVPSGVSYMLENRQLMKRLFPEVFQASNILPVDDYPTQLHDTLADLSPRQGTRPVVAVDLVAPPARIVEQGEVLQHSRVGAGERGEAPTVLEHAAPVVDAVHAGRVQPVLIQDPGQEIDEHPASLPGRLSRVKGLRYSRLRPRGPLP